MRNRFADTFYELGRADERLCLVVADISPAGSISRFREEFPGRFVNTGVAEQIMIGMAAGMALRGLRPFAYTIATFALYRPFEFIRDDLCYQNLPVTVVGIGGGVTYSTLGGTHHAMEDIAVASAIPNMRVIAPCDPDEVEAATRWCAGQTDGPVYLRLGKAGEPILTAEAPEPWRFGKLRMVRDGGTDLAFLTYGPIAGVAARLAQDAGACGQGATVFHCSTLKPLDRQGIAEVLARFPRVIVLEESVAAGGLGNAVRGIAQEHGSTARLLTYGLHDDFIHVHGRHEDLLAAHGLCGQSIAQALFA